MLDFSMFKSYAMSGLTKQGHELVTLSGGRSSAYTLMMLIKGGLLNRNYTISFQNTGIEDNTCYEFLNALEKELKIKFTWLEFTITDKFKEELLMPSFNYFDFVNCNYKDIWQILDLEKLRNFNYKKSSKNPWYKEKYFDNKGVFKQVSYESANKVGIPFIDAFLYKCAIRVMKDMDLILPNGGQRWCTADLKTKTAEYYMKSKGLKFWYTYMGMRFDEPNRVDKLFRQNDTCKYTYYDCPMHWEKIEKSDVLNAWINQPIDLGLKKDKSNCFRDVIGNCTNGGICHLKSKTKKLYLIQQGIDVGLFNQIERLVNKYNGTSDSMSRQHGSYDSLILEAQLIPKITEKEILSDSEKEIQCFGCGD